MDPSETRTTHTSTQAHDENPAPEEEDEDQPMIDDDDDDEGPQFVTVGEDGVIEVPVDEDHVPMEDDEDDDDDDVAGTSSSTPDQSQHQIRAHTDSVYAISAAPSPHSDAQPSSPQLLTVVSGGGDDRAFWHTLPLLRSDNPTTTTATITTTLQLSHAHTDSVAATAVNWTCPQYNATTTPAVMAVAGYDGAIVLYQHPLVVVVDNSSMAAPTLLEGPSDVEWLRFHPTGTVLLAGSATDGTVWMYHIGSLQQPQPQCLQVLVGHEAAVTAGDFTPNGKWVVTASADGTVRVWAPKTGRTKHVFRFNHSNNSDTAAAAGLTCLHVGGGTEGKLILVGAEDGRAHLCHAGTNKVVASWRHSEVPPSPAVDDDDDDDEPACSVEAVGFCPSNPHWCATAGADGTLKIWDLTHDHQCRHVCRHDEGAGVTRLQWLPDLPVVVTTTTVGTVHLWDARSGRPLQPPLTTGSSATLNDLQVVVVEEGASSVVVIVTAGDDHVVRVFQVDVKQLLQQQQQ